MTIFQNVPYLFMMWCHHTGGKSCWLYEWLWQTSPVNPFVLSKVAVGGNDNTRPLRVREGQLISTQLLVSLVIAYWLSNVLKLRAENPFISKTQSEWLKLVECLWMPMAPFYVRRSWCKVTIDLLCRVYAKRSESEKRALSKHFSQNKTIYENA